MTPYTDPFHAKLIIFSLCILACAVSFILGRISTWMFDQTEEESLQNEEGQE